MRVGLSGFMRVLVTGPESSGTSLVSRIFRAAGAQVEHRSATFKDDQPNIVLVADSCDVVIVVYRNPMATMKSQMAQGLSIADARRKLVDGYHEIARMFTYATVPFWCVTYESLVLDPDSIRPLLALLHLSHDIDIEPVRDENAKYVAQ